MTPEQADSILDQIIKANEIKLGRFTTKEGLEGVEKVLETFGFILLFKILFHSQVTYHMVA